MTEFAFDVRVSATVRVTAPTLADAVRYLRAELVEIAGPVLPAGQGGQRGEVTEMSLDLLQSPPEAAWPRLGLFEVDGAALADGESIELADIDIEALSLDELTKGHTP